MSPEPYPQHIPPNDFYQQLVKLSGEPSARAYAMTEKRNPVAAAKQYGKFKDTVRAIYAPVVRNLYRGGL